MEEQKVYLFVETPFSFRKPKGFLILPMMFSLVIYAAMITLFWLKMPDNAMMLTVAFACASVFSAIWIAVFRLSYVTVEDGCLVCRYCGFIPRRICIGPQLQVKTAFDQLRVVAGSAVLLRLPDSDAARRLLASARIPVGR